jgi:hypothetical protein
MDDMRASRPLGDIQTDIAVAARQLVELRQERRRVRTVRRDGIVVDFDAGMTRAAIAAKWGVGYGHVAAVLHRARRTARRRFVHGLSDAERADFHRLLRMGVGAATARAIALRDR